MSQNAVFRARNEVFRHFHEIDVSGGLDIAQYGSTINKLCVISIIYARRSQKGPKKRS